MIRPYTADDKSVVMSIWRAANARAHPFLSAEFVATAETMIRDQFLDMAETWLIDSRNQPVGFIALIGNEIGGLFVHPDHHGRGFGRALVDHATALHGALELEVFRDNAVGRRFYDRYGFATGAETMDDFSGHPVLRMTFTPG